MSSDKKLTYSAISEFAFRKQRLEKAYKALLNKVSGINERYWDDGKDLTIRNEVYSEFIQTLELYRGHRLQFMGEESLLADLKPDSFSEEDRELYSTFMDTVFSLAVFNEPGEINWYSEAGTWGAVIERIEQPLSYKNASELHKDLIAWNEIVEVGGTSHIIYVDVNVPEGIFYSLSRAYKAVTGENLSSLLTEEQRKAAIELMSEDVKKYLKMAKENPSNLRESVLKERREDEAWRAQLTDEEINKMFNGSEALIKSYKEVKDQMARWGNPTIDQVEAINNTVKNTLREERNRILATAGIVRREGSMDDWKSCFNSEDFKKACLLLLDKGVDLYNRKYFKDDCINALHITLSQCGIGSWLDGGKYFTVYNNMREVIRSPRKIVRRPGRGIKDEVLTLVRDDFDQNQNESFLYKYIVDNNEKLKKKIQDNPEKKDSIISKYIQDTMTNYGYPVTKDKVTNSYKESTKKNVSNPPLEMIDAWYKYYSKKIGGIEGADNVNKVDLPLEEYDRFFKSICKSKSSDSILIPIRMDSKSGAGLYIIGKDYYAKGYFKYPDSFHCGIDYISNWDNIAGCGIAQSIAYNLVDNKCDSVITANDFFEKEIVLEADVLGEFKKMNGTMPVGCPKALQKYFYTNDSEDKK